MLPYCFRELKDGPAKISRFFKRNVLYRIDPKAVTIGERYPVFKAVRQKV